MKLVLLTQDYPPRPGGMARYYADLSRGLGARCTVAVGTWEGATPQRQGAESLLSFPFAMDASHRPWNLLRAHRAVSRALESDTEALLVGNVRPYGPLGSDLARASRVPLVMIYHGNDLLRTARRWSRHPWKRRAWRRVVDGAALHVVNSAFTAEKAVELGLPEAAVAVVHPEVDLGRFHPAADAAQRTALRARFGWGSERCVTLFVGRLARRKGIDDLIRALPGVPPSVDLVIAGPGDRAPWRDQVRTAGLEDRVRFLGHVPAEDLPLLHRAADIFVGPSTADPARDDVEGFGIVFLEASASGLPVLATRTGGIPEAVEEGVGGILVPPGSPVELGEAWRRLAEDAVLRARLGRGGLEGRARAHGAGSSATRLREALNRALSARGDSGTT